MALSRAEKALQLDEHHHARVTSQTSIVIRHSARPHCYEFKCYSPFTATRALGLGSDECGGAASTADGGRFALGNTEEALVVLIELGIFYC